LKQLISVPGLLVLAALMAPSAGAVVRLAPQVIVDSVLNQGLESRAIQLEARKSDLPLARAQGAYDWTFNANSSYELTRLETLSGLSNLEDRNRLFSVGFSKKLPTGTALSLKYNRNYQDSITSSFLSSAHPPDQVLDFVDLGFRQDLLSNFFGIQERRRTAMASRDVAQADLRRKENLEDLVLDAVALYWKAYVSEAALREAIQAREKFGLLVRTVERKRSLGLAEPSDVAKVKTEFSSQDRHVKSASLQYLSDLDRLFSAAQLPYEKDVEFDVSLDLPAPPDDPAVELDELRPVTQARLRVENAQAGLANAKMDLLPKVTLFGQMSFNGVDQQPGQSFSELTSGVHPRYLLGIELNYPLWSESLRGEARHQELLQDEAFNEMNRAREARSIELKQAERSVRSNYIIARMAKDTMIQWEKIIEDRERLFRNARVGTAEIIQDYSFYFRSKADHVAAVADYYYSYHRLRAAKDELVP